MAKGDRELEDADAQSSVRQLFVSLLLDDGIERFAGAYARQYDVLHAEVIATGLNSLVSLRMRTIAARALTLGANQLIVAHNHPSGVAWPSSIDVDSTRRLRNTLAALDILLIDHLIFAGSTVFSMRRGVYYRQ